MYRRCTRATSTRRALRHLPRSTPLSSRLSPSTRYGCHNTKLRTADLDLTAFSSATSIAKDVHTWEKVAEMVRTKQMPPKGVPPLTDAEVKTVAGWIDAEFERLEKAEKPDPGRVTAPPAEPTEYNNTVRDLLGVDFRPADDFPPDDSGYGFDNIGDVLSLSPVLMEKYLEAAGDSRPDGAVRPPNLSKRRTSAASRLRGTAFPSTPALTTNRLGPLPASALHVRYDFPATAGYVTRGSLATAAPAKGTP